MYSAARNENAKTDVEIAKAMTCHRCHGLVDSEAWNVLLIIYPRLGFAWES